MRRSQLLLISLSIIPLLTFVPSVRAYTCGNGVKESGEACDDGNKLNSDGCSSSCLVVDSTYFDCSEDGAQLTTCVEKCGDGYNFKKRLPAITSCDDGNTNANDGCSTSCQKESGWLCTGGTSTSKDTCTEKCGDGYDFCGGQGNTCKDGTYTQSSTCDDGNTVNRDGCSSSCKVEDGWYCTVGAVGTDTSDPTVCYEICGDQMDFGKFPCETGGDSDGCVDCALVAGWKCSGGSYTSVDTCSEVCGDGYHYSQACDDNNKISGDGCSSTCTIEDGFYVGSDISDTALKTEMIEDCDGEDYGYLECDCGLSDCTGCEDCVVIDGYTCLPPDLPEDGSECSEVCGDGYNYQQGSTICDDGNNRNGDGCSNVCTIEDGYQCKFGTTSEPDECYEICGDSKDLGTYPCDDGNSDDNDGCYECEVLDGWYCYGGTTTTSDTCYENCGDGRIYTTDATACDDGNNDDGDGCSALCVIESGYDCIGGGYDFADYCLEKCGDGLKMTNDIECDDGDVYDGDGCDSDCYIEYGFECSGGSTTTPDVCEETCGDGMRYTATSVTTFCDDANNVAGDGCDDTCGVEDGFECYGGDDTQPDTCYELCGDGKNMGTLECDDSNPDSSDGCSATCEVEDGYDCTGGDSSTADTCTEICNDGLSFGSFDCDDGTAADYDGCTTNCEIVDGWYCWGGDHSTASTCEEHCGDGWHYVKDPGTLECDDGGNDNDDGCSADCLIETGWGCDTDWADYETASVCYEICGDGLRFNSETDYCDTGAAGVAVDGCNADCSVQDGWYCYGGDSSTADACFEICGDGKRFVLDCDDSNGDNYDGCNSNCEKEDGFYCWNDDDSSPVRRMLAQATDYGLTKCNEICGDGSGDWGQYPCDDGNTNDNDGCSATCQLEVGWSCDGGDKDTAHDTCTEICGDAYDVRTFDCDDGNNIDNDGCTDCAIDTGYDCENSATVLVNPGRYASDTCTDICGDGKLMDSANFACDDANTDDNDGCDSDCQLEEGYYCIDHSHTSQSNCFEICGDNIDMRHFDCDDGNSDDDDGCTGCAIDDGYYCVDSLTEGTPGRFGSDQCFDECGDGQLMDQTLYKCDDANNDEYDGCDADCQIEEGWYCIGHDHTTQSSCFEKCGDAYDFREYGCDDGNTNSDDGCSDACAIEDGYYCVDSTNLVSGETGYEIDYCYDICGDGKLLDSTMYGCDDAGNADYDGCDADCQVEEGWYCIGHDHTTQSTCYEKCGDAYDFREYGCDDGNTNSDDGCSDACAIEDGYYCVDSLSLVSGESGYEIDYCYDICGDGKLLDSTMYGCDDAGNADYDGCDADCQIEEGWYCIGHDHTTQSTCYEKCGDSYDFREYGCDDGNTNSDDGCSDACDIEDGYYCVDSTDLVSGQSGYEIDFCYDICGDGKLLDSTMYKCDDAGNADYDGCNEDCQVEEGWYCIGHDHTTKSNCYEICGDEYDFREYGCDDGNTNSNDGCSISCGIEDGYYCVDETTLVLGLSGYDHDSCFDDCGDGKLLDSTMYKCDDAGNDDYDGCNADCQIEEGWYCNGQDHTTKSTCYEICGDEYDFREYACDDGNTNSNDGCSVACAIEDGYYCVDETTLVLSQSGYDHDSCFDICGDGKLLDSTLYKCDDADNDSYDGCSAGCLIEDGWYCYGHSHTTQSYCYELCGDQYDFGNFGCDDGNTVDTDGCTQCAIDDGYYCVDSTTLVSGLEGYESDACWDTCGDGKLMDSTLYECDDSNSDNYDGCTGCMIDDGFYCYGGSHTDRDYCYEICGDGYYIGLLECDDGNSVANDGCTNCELDDGYYCSDISTLAILINPYAHKVQGCFDICGDGKLMDKSLYACDDSNIANGEGCSAKCQVERGYYCQGGSHTTKDTCYEVCGDGYNMPLVTGDCDDFNYVAGDGCSSACAIEDGWYCYGGNENQKDTCYEICGDIYDMGKFACDDGGQVADDGCSAKCAVEDGWYCYGGNKLGTAQDKCYDICGDGKLRSDGTTECDDGSDTAGIYDGCNGCQVVDGWYCYNTGVDVASLCFEIPGDGMDYHKFECDNSDTTTDGCTNGEYDTGYLCSGGTPTNGGDTCWEICGDGLNPPTIGGGTDCDDGDTSAGDGCSATCTVEDGWYCYGGSVSAADSCFEQCGDGKDFLTFECDDGNTNSNDGCSSDCDIETGYDCTGGNSSTQDTCTEICGDGLDLGHLECDDGDTSSNDGCSSTCEIESGYDCTGGTSTSADTCVAVCGDGLIRANEVCDDGNTNANDGCSADCLTIETGYDCDGAEPTTCWEICGDGKNMGHVACDDGNTANGDGCDDECVEELGYDCTGGTTTTQDTCTRTSYITPSLTDCDTFAALFFSTCSEAGSNTAASSVTGMTADAESCDMGYGKCIGTVDGDDACSWSRKLCVTCSTSNGYSMIRVQTNSVPDHCYYAPTVKPVTNNIDFSVAFSAQSNVKTLPSTTALAQSQLDDYLCTSKWAASSTATTTLTAMAYSLHEGTNMSSIVGIALNGVPIFSGISELGFDAHYPKTYKGSAGTAINADFCLGDNDYTPFYHYYSMSPCLLDGTYKSLQIGKSCSSDSSCKSNIQKHMYTVKSAYKVLTPVGIARDGHKIYGPYDATGKLWQPCDVDICNGKTINGEYAYVMTYFFPYTVGCFGTGNKPLLQASCSTNPRKCTGADSSSTYISFGYMFMALMSILYVLLQ